MEQMERKFTDIIELDDGWEIDSDTGFEPISKICQTVEYDIWVLRTKSYELKCADNHKVFDERMEPVYVKNLQVGQLIHTESGLEPVLLVYNSGAKEQMYDVEVNTQRHRYFSNGILSHNTTVTVAYLLYYMLFNQDKALCILANKLSQAQEILERLQTAYINLPKWMQVGVEEWNKRSIKLENGCSILAAATSSDSVRGRSYALVFIDECVSGDSLITVFDTILKISFDTQIQNIWKYAVYTDRADIRDNNRYKVLTTDGFKDFTGIKKTSGIYLELEFDDGKQLKCSPEHKLINKDGSRIYAKDISIGQEIDGRILTKKTEYNDVIDLYDLLNVGEKSTYLINGINSSNCAFVSKNLWSKFWTSTWPTISSGKHSRFIIVSTPNGKNHFYDFWKGAIDGTNDYYPLEVNWWDVPGRDEQWKKNQLKTMSEEQFNVEYGNSFLASSGTLLNPDTLIRIRDDVKQPIQFASNSRIYELPEQGKQYVATVDCADDGDDYSTISIIDITQYPFKQVAVYADNKISALSFPMVIEQFAKKYNEAFVLVESNNIGNTVLYILNYDIEYENIIRTVNKQGKLKIGQLTTGKTKSAGCSRLKDMLDTGKLIIQDMNTYSELGHFCKKGSSYEAETGYHDDMVMGLVNFAYYATTNDFRNLIDKNFADEYREEMEHTLEESLSPLPLFGADILRGNILGNDDIAWLNS